MIRWRSCLSFVGASYIRTLAPPFCSGTEGMFSGVFRSMCHTAESPELPMWVKCPEPVDSPGQDSEDDFVLPSKLDSLEDPPAVWKGYDGGCTTKPVDKSDTSVENLSLILNSVFTSPDAVVQALNGCVVTVSGDLVSTILRRHNNDWISAFGFFKWVVASQSLYKHSADSYDLMVDILGKSKQFDAMWSLIDEMAERKLVSLSTMTRVMRRLAVAGRWKEAIATFHDVEQFGIEKDTSAMNILFDALCKERSVMRARDVFFEVRDSVSPDASTFNILIHGWCKAGKLEEARWTMEEMRQSGFNPCVISYTMLIEAYCQDKNFRKVDSILEEMQASGCSPNVITYTIVMHSLGKAKATNEALLIYDKMKDNGCAPDTSFYNSLIYILGRAGRLRDANVIYLEMNRNGCPPNLTTYNTLISAACLHCQEENALGLLLEMEKASCEPDIKTYVPLLKYCCRRKQMRILHFLLDDMYKKNISLDVGTYTLLVQRLCLNGKLQYSCLFFEKMVLKGFLPRHHTFNILLEALEREKLHDAKDKIQGLMVQAEKNNLFPSSMRGK